MNWFAISVGVMNAAASGFSLYNSKYLSGTIWACYAIASICIAVLEAN